MYGQLSNAAIAALKANSGLVTVPVARLGDGYNYVPGPSDTGIRGSLVYETAPSEPEAQNANMVRYSMFLDINVGPFEFGELELRMANGELFALFAASELIEKLPVGPNQNTIRIDAFVTMTGIDNYRIWLALDSSNNQMRLPVLNSPDFLPPYHDAAPNAYIIAGATANQSAMMAMTDGYGLWSFDKYAYADSYSGTVVEVNANYVAIDAAEFEPEMSPGYYGQLIMQFTTGSIFGICRYVSSATVVGNVVRFNFGTPLAVLPNVGDMFMVVSRQALSIAGGAADIPIATPTRLGGIMIGAGLVAAPDGRTSIDLNWLGDNTVTSIGGVTGPVDQIPASMVTGLATIATTGQWQHLQGKPSTFNPPVATDIILGGVRIPQGGSFAIDAQGNLSLDFTPVTSVNGESGDIIIPSLIGLVGPLLLEDGDDLNTFTSPGLFYLNGSNNVVNGPQNYRPYDTLEVIPSDSSDGTARCVQRWTSRDWFAIRATDDQGVFPSNWTVFSTGGIPIASTAQLGGIIVGQGLSINANGQLNANVASVNGKTDTNIQLAANDVGAVATNEVGVQGGVPGFLSSDPNVATEPPIESNFNFNRMPTAQLPRDGLVSAGVWNATTNKVTGIDHFSPRFIEAELKDNGMVEITYDDPDSGSTTTFLTSGLGWVLRVGTAGSVAVDGESSWDVNDILVSILGRWVKITSSGGINLPPFTAITLTANGGTQDVVWPGILDHRKAMVDVRVQTPTDPDVWTDATAVCAVEYREANIKLTNKYSQNLTFRLRVVSGD